jgi:transposase
MGKSIRNLAAVTWLGSIWPRTRFRFTPSTRTATSSRRGSSGGASLWLFFAKLPRCLVAMEAGSSAHHWGRQLMALGHEVKLIPPAHVKPGACPRA